MQPLCEHAGQSLAFLCFVFILLCFPLTLHGCWLRITHAQLQAHLKASNPYSACLQRALPYFVSVNQEACMSGDPAFLAEMLCSLKVIYCSLDLAQPQLHVKVKCQPSSATESCVQPLTEPNSE